MVTIQFIPHSKISHLSSGERINLLLKEAKTDKIIFLEGRLRPDEEAMLIKTTMEQISRRFKGIELAVVNPGLKGRDFVDTARNALAGMLLGNRVGFTVIGPASIVKEIKKDPERIELLMKKR